MRSPILLSLAVALASVASPSVILSAEEPSQYYEVRSYLLGSDGDADAIDGYLRDALIPALRRRDVGPVGVFTDAGAADDASARIVVVIPYDSPGRMAEVKSAIDTDDAYREAAHGYLERGAENPPYERIRSEFLVAMDCMPRLTVPSGTLANHERVYELRTYESGNERLGQLKVEMFNAGEVPIFIDSGIQPIFIGDGLIGPHLPSLTYLTVYDDEQARQEAWDTFREHPDWKELSRLRKYQGTVSRMHRFVLVPKPYSQM
jgi:hypothetical protein